MKQKNLALKQRDPPITIVLIYVLKLKNTMTHMRNERVKLMNDLRVTIRKRATESFIMNATNIWHLIQQALKNNSIKN